MKSYSLEWQDIKWSQEDNFGFKIFLHSQFVMLILLSDRDEETRTLYQWGEMRKQRVDTLMT